MGLTVAPKRWGGERQAGPPHRDDPAGGRCRYAPVTGPAAARIAAPLTTVAAITAAL